MWAYRETTGTTPTVRTRAPWLRSMRDESPRSPRTRTGITGAEGIVVVTVAIAVVAFEVWFFFFSGSPIDQRSGR